MMILRYGVEDRSKVKDGFIRGVYTVEVALVSVGFALQVKQERERGREKESR